MDIMHEVAHITDKVQALSNIELAVLICLVADQHCIIECEERALDELGREISLVASNVFHLTHAVLECTENTSLDEFGNGILTDEDSESYFGHGSVGMGDINLPSVEQVRLTGRRTPKSPRHFSSLDGRRIANVVIVKGLNLASSQVQVQALELVRGRRNFTRTAVHVAPKPFLFIAVNAKDKQPMNTHLTDQMFISHTHQADDEFPNLKRYLGVEHTLDDNASLSSVLRTSPYSVEKSKASPTSFSRGELSQLTALISNTKISSEARAYLHNIVVFMRLHRAVAGGISAMATRHFAALAHALAPLHGLSYVTPSLVALAARKVYPHRIVLASPERERSMQWGSSIDAVKAVLDGVTVEDVIEEVLQSVEAPL
ncbi:hypothetical protein B0J11DRAFT_515242 [Dendryphion nanum]|uniref:magnesium chelatase n=1 Tax=Dendryphion nanum TaxID=256645 RepID=A0A9P9IWZ9_9PLEO|nr:hypothetical protein B0J11DRAFT_515242 [Dendryphion nanum]